MAIPMHEIWQTVENLTEQIVEQQKAELLRCGRRIVPTLTPEDVLQPNDYPELETNPLFRYEEGVLAGLLTLQTALRREMRDSFQKTLFQEATPAIESSK